MTLCILVNSNLLKLKVCLRVPTAVKEIKRNQVWSVELLCPIVSHTYSTKKKLVIMAIL